MSKLLLRSAIFALIGVSMVSLTPSAHAVGVGCTAEYKKAVEDCSNLPDWDDRSICGLDAAIEYTGCVRRAITGI